MKILLADDDRDAVLTLQNWLESGGHQIVVAYSGADAIQQARSEKPDAAILDVSMPGMTGNDVAVALRREPCCEDMLLIALTGWSSPEDRLATGGPALICTWPSRSRSRRSTRSLPNIS